MIRENLNKILESINIIKEKNSIDYDIKLMAVSKTKPVEDIKDAIDAGHILFGENRVLEAYDKFTLLKEEDRVFDLHLIGHLQRNKAKKACEVASMIESVDKISTLDAIEKHCSLLDKRIDYLIEVNTSFEPQKNGVVPDNFSSLLTEINDNNYKYCNLRGLMTVGPLTYEEEDIRKSFRLLKELYVKIKNDLQKDDFDILSMGMSGDYEIAIEEGSNLIRVGSAIFGNRNY